MSRSSAFKTMAVVLWVVIAASAIAVGDVTLTFSFTDLESHVGQSLTLRVVDTASLAEVARVAVPSILDGAFQVDVASFTEGRTYRVDYFLDQNGNGFYDAPPTDAAWSFFLSSIEGPGLVDVPHIEEFTDIDWPPLIDGVILSGEYRHALTEPSTGIAVSWQNDAAVLYVALVSPGTGWVGIGLDPTSRMQGANYILAAVSDGVLSITDEFGVSGTLHRTDAQSNVIQAAGHEADGSTVLEFAIPLSSGDLEDKALAPWQTVAVLLALSQNQDNFTARHTARSATSITLDGGN